MPKLYLPVPEIEKSITRPVMLEIIRQVKDITGIDPATKEVFLGEAKSGLQKGSDVSSNILDNTGISATKQLTIEVSESYNENYLGTVAIGQAEQIPIFVDNELGIVLKPIYTSRNFEITVRFRNNSKTEAKAWRDNIYTHVNHMRDINLHEINYHYSIPEAFIVLLKKLHSMREAVDGYGENFETYFNNFITTRATEGTTLTGNKVETLIAESQFRVQGMFNFTEAPEKEQMGGETNMWMSEFSYKVTIDVPTQIHMQYPIMVHNQILDEKYIPLPAPDDDKHDKAFSRSLKAIHRFESPAIIDRSRPFPKLVLVPEYDDWWPDNAPPTMYPLISALCELLPDNRKLLLNLRELGDYAIDDEILDYLQKVEYPYLTLPFKSIFHMSYYRFKFLSSDKNTYVDKDLNFCSREDLSLRKNHRAVLNIVTDVTGIDPACFKRMRKYPNVLKKALKAINVTYPQLVRLSPVIDLTGFMPELRVSGMSKREMYSRFTQFYTVNSSYVVTRLDGQSDKIKDHSTNKQPLYNPPVERR